MTTRTILGSLANQSRPCLGQPGGNKILTVANFLGNRGSNKENQVENVKKIKPTTVTPRYGVKKSNKKICVEVEPMEVEEKLPEGVIDIDADSEDMTACAEYARDITVYLRALEPEHAVRENFLEGAQLTSKMRSLLVDWLVSVHHQFDLVPETLFICINLLDRYLAARARHTGREELQLVGLTCLLLAAKMEEILLPSMEDWLYSTDNAYTEPELRAMELNILSALNFRLAPPIALTFLRRYSRAGDVDVLEHALSKYILELSLLDYGQTSSPPSLAAAAALHLSLVLLEPPGSAVWSPSLQHHTGRTSAELLPTVQRMAVVLGQAASHRLQAVREKFSSRRLRRVAVIAETSQQFVEERLSGLG